MAKVGRNQPCPCGSGRKAKRCCGVPRGPSESQLATAYLAVQARNATAALVGCGETDLEPLFNQLPDLPERDLSLQPRLPRVLPPEIERLRRALEADDVEEFDAGLPDALRRLDTPIVRAQLARGVVGLRDAERLDERLAAVAIIDLASDSTYLLTFAIAAALAVSTGSAPTPSGLIVATRPTTLTGRLGS